MIHGSCLCGDIRYEINGSPEAIGRCDCIDCRKITGSSFSANLLVKKDDFHWSEGKENISVYKVSEDVSRVFCPKCGSNLQFIANEYPGVIGVAVGTIDDNITATANGLLSLNAWN